MHAEKKKPLQLHQKQNTATKTYTPKCRITWLHEKVLQTR